jgi:hypothetical protein
MADGSQALSDGLGRLRATLQVTQDRPLRFAVAAFNTLGAAQRVSLELTSIPNAPSTVSYLGLHEVLDLGTADLEKLPFPANRALVACSKGLVADRLASCLGGGVGSLRGALATWLIPRHAAEIERAVENGDVVIWAQLQDNEDERRAYRTLLAAGCHSVGVHDLVRP